MSEGVPEGVGGTPPPTELLPVTGSSRTGDLVIRVPGSLIYRAVMFVILGGIVSAAGLHERLYAEVGVGVACILFAAGTLRIRVVADDRGLVARNLLKTHRLRWSDLRRLDVVEAPLRMGVGAFGVKRHRVAATTSTGETIVLQATQSLHGDERSTALFGRDAAQIWRDALQARWPRSGEASTIAQG